MYIGSATEAWLVVFFFFSSRRRHTRWTGDWSSDVCSSDLLEGARLLELVQGGHSRGHRRRVSRERAAVEELVFRSEERRVGKEYRSRLLQNHEKEKA